MKRKIIKQYGTLSREDKLIVKKIIASLARKAEMDDSNFRLSSSLVELNAQRKGD